MRLFFCILFSVIFIGSAHSQDKQDRIKRIEALKAAYITKKLDLTPDEAKGFWPVYNNYQHEISNLYRQKRQNQFNHRENPKEALSNDMDYDNKILDVKKKYQKEFSRILPAQKVLDLYNAEREFREELIKELRDRRKE
ncbi:hypothetical protein [Rubrolithibacter danxiaensis]|uniref:hypothetical protein n=1 Tax=Rubrolithibacter danxiaensis TaxID=3390805 RepID=UPI003BF8FB44